MTKEFCKSIGLKESKPLVDKTISDFEINCSSAYVVVRFKGENCDCFIVTQKIGWRGDMVNKVISNAPTRERFLMAVKICKCEDVLNLNDVK